MMMGVADLPIETLKALKIHPDSNQQRADVGAHSSTKRDASGGVSPNVMPSSGATVSSTGSDDVAAVANMDANQASDVPSLGPTSQGDNDGALSTSQVPSEKDSRPNTPISGASSMAHTSAGLLDPSPSASRSGFRSGDHRESSPSPRPSDRDRPPDRFDFESALQTGKGVSRMVGAGVKSPMDFTLALAKGFHNAPKLYGDKSVRQSEKITGIQSGLVAATRVGPDAKCTSNSMLIAGSNLVTAFMTV